VTATGAGSGKIARLAALLAGFDGYEIPIAVAMPTGSPRRGRIGIGWRTLAARDAAPLPSLTIPRRGRCPRPVGGDLGHRLSRGAQHRAA